MDSDRFALFGRFFGEPESDTKEVIANSSDRDYRRCLKV